MSEPRNIDRAPAFPVPLQFTDSGMELRDYFAANAMQVLLDGHWGSDKDGSEYAYKIADAMMEARNK